MAPNSKVALYIAMYRDGDNYKHWALYIDDVDDDIILNVRGSAGHWRFEQQNDHNPRESRSLHDLVYVATIKKSQVPRLIETARSLPLKQTKPAWNCQNYVLDLIDEIDGTMINISDAEFDALARKMDGLV